MKTTAGVLWGTDQDWQVVDLDLDGPKSGEVLVRFVAAGLCHSDEHLRLGDIVPRFPIVGGHEGTGVVEEVSSDVTRLKPGDHVVTSYLPVCGVCRWCSTGRTNLCDTGANMLTGSLLDGTFRFHKDGEDFGAMSMLGTFSRLATVSEKSCIRIDDDIPLETAALVGCGVPTGWGAAIRSGAPIEPGDTVVVYGVGGVGINSVQGAAFAGAGHVVAVDPLPNKRAMAAKLGATHTCTTSEEAAELVRSLTRGVGADKAIVAVGVVDQEVVSAAFDVVRKAGALVVVGLAHPERRTISLSGAELTLNEKIVQGSLYGSGNPFHEVPRLLNLYRDGQLRLDELATHKYALEDLNRGYADMTRGESFRGILVHEPR